MPGAKKKAGGGKKGKKKSSTKEKIVIHTETTLPPITSVKCATLQATVVQGDQRSLERLVAHYDFGKNLNERDANGSSLIHIAVKKRDLQLLQRLLEYRAIPINATESPTIGGHTALHVACAQDDLAAVKILLQSGANPNTQSNSALGDTPLMVCCKHGFTACAHALLAHGALPEARDKFGNNASFWASEHRQTTLARDLGLPPVHTATVDEFVNILRQRIPNFVLPSIKKKEKKKDGKGKKKK